MSTIYPDDWDTEQSTGLEVRSVDDLRVDSRTSITEFLEVLLVTVRRRSVGRAISWYELCIVVVDSLSRYCHSDYRVDSERDSDLKEISLRVEEILSDFDTSENRSIDAYVSGIAGALHGINHFLGDQLASAVTLTDAIDDQQVAVLLKAAFMIE